ncbi:NAD-dependent epimerase/dehydratase family protein, partial [Hellea sp.]|nr:NAD-dependent epimerase/dehydratase family protein [Hellea sp.]
MRIIITGGDGFCGWPTALHLSSQGHDIIIIDNLSRRRIDEALGVCSLTPISDMALRLKAWQQISGETIGFENLDLAADYNDLLRLISEYKPDAIVHFGEQRSAPYSMKSAETKAYTIHNNINGTHNLLSAIVESGLDVHLVHLGSIGVYGYTTAGLTIPEGYLSVNVTNDKGQAMEKDILYPTDPGSIYHMTKVQDQTMFAFYNKNDELRITDLHQGIVWGTQTRETSMDLRLINRFDYDGDYGTVLNRFILQAVIDHPISVYGSGGQTRAFINIQDCVHCIEIALQSAPQKGDKVRILNQATEMFDVMSLAKLISARTGAKINCVPNPRKED